MFNKKRKQLLDDLLVLKSKLVQGEDHYRVKKEGDEIDIKIGQTVNEILDLLINPVKEGNKILAELAEGRIIEQTAKEYRGESENTRKYISKISRQLNYLNTEMSEISKEISRGRLESKIETKELSGVFSSIAGHNNTAVETLLHPVFSLTQKMENFCEGNKDAKIIIDFPGEFGRLKNSYNYIIGNIDALNESIISLQKFHDAGDIDVVVSEEHG